MMNEPKLIILSSSGKDHPQPKRKVCLVHKSAICSRNIGFAKLAAQQVTSFDPAEFRASAERARKAVGKADIEQEVLAKALICKL